MTEYLDMIRKIAWSYVKSYPGLEFDDMFSEACVAYLRAEKDFSPDKGKKSTFMWHVINNELTDIINKTTIKNNYEMCIDDFDFPYHQTPEQIILEEEGFSEIMGSLSDGAKEICSLVLNEPDIFLPLNKPRECRGEIMRELRSREWGWGKIWSAFRELKEVFSCTA